MMILFSSLILVLVHDPRYLYSVYQRKHMEWQLQMAHMATEFEEKLLAAEIKRSNAVAEG